MCVVAQASFVDRLPQALADHPIAFLTGVCAIVISALLVFVLVRIAGAGRISPSPSRVRRPALLSGRIALAALVLAALAVLAATYRGPYRHDGAVFQKHQHRYLGDASALARERVR